MTQPTLLKSVRSVEDHEQQDLNRFAEIRQRFDVIDHTLDHIQVSIREIRDHVDNMLSPRRRLRDAAVLAAVVAPGVLVVMLAVREWV